MYKTKNNQELLAKINEIVSTLDIIIANTPDENDTITNKQLDNALNLIDKEKKKTIPKIDLLAAVRHIYSATNSRDAMTAGLSYGFSQEQIKKVMVRAPVDTPLGKVIAKLKSQPIPVSPTPTPHLPPPPPAVRTPTAPVVLEDEEDDVTNDSDSDIDMDDELRAKLGI
jgi:hypothetical protein